jgi:hypothetical protein
LAGLGKIVITEFTGGVEVTVCVKVEKGESVKVGVGLWVKVGVVESV